MQEIFTSRDAAVLRLLYRKRELLHEAENVGWAGTDAGLSEQLADIERLLLDVRAARLAVFDMVGRDNTVVRIYIS